PSFILRPRAPPSPTLFPYTTLFRSGQHNPGIGLAELHPQKVRFGDVLIAHDRLVERDQDGQLDQERKTPGHGIDVVFLEELHRLDRKSTRLNSSHVKISYAVFCLKK